MFSLILRFFLKYLFRNKEFRTPKSQRKQVDSGTLEPKALIKINSPEVVPGPDINKACFTRLELSRGKHFQGL